MKVRDFLETNCESNLRVLDNLGNVVAMDNDNENIPAFLFDANVVTVSIEKGVLVLRTEYNDQTNCLGYVEDEVQRIRERLSDEYWCDSVESLNKALLEELGGLSVDIERIHTAIAEGNDWDIYL